MYDTETRNLTTIDAERQTNNRLHQDLVYRDYPVGDRENQVHHLASARGLTKYEFGPKSLDELKNEQLRLQRWGAKFAGANQLLKNEVETLKAELQRAYEADPLRSGQHVTKEAYDLLAKEYDEAKKELNKLQATQGVASDYVHRLKVARDQANEERNESVNQAVSAADTVAKLRTQLQDAQRIAMQKQGAVQDLDHRLTEMTSRYDILSHHVLQLGEEKTSLLEALRERQTQLDFCLAQLQLLDRDSKLNAHYQQRIKDLEDELERLKREHAEERKRLMDEIARLTKMLQDCGEARKQLEDQLNRLRAGGGLSAPDSKGMMKFGGTKSPPLVKPKIDITADSKGGAGFAKPKPPSGVMKEEVKTGKATKEYKEGTEVIQASKDDGAVKAKTNEEVIRHRGLVIKVRWHPSSGKHTYGTRFLQVDSKTARLGWSKGEKDPVSKVINFDEIARIAYGYASHMTDYKRRFDCPPGAKTPSSGSGKEDQLTAPPVGASKGLLATWPRISLTSCFTIVSKDGRVFDFFTATDSETFDWMMRLSRVLKPHGVDGLHDRMTFLAARGWTRLIEQCCLRQITCRRLLIEGLEKAGVFAATTGLGTGGGQRKPRVSATKTGGSNAKVFKGGAGLVFRGASNQPSAPSDNSWMKRMKAEAKATAEKDAKRVAELKAASKTEAPLKSDAPKAEAAKADASKTSGSTKTETKKMDLKKTEVKEPPPPEKAGAAASSKPAEPDTPVKKMIPKKV